MRVAVLTSGRQDWGILRSTCLLLRNDRRFELLLFVGGMHLATGFGDTARVMAMDGFEPAERLDWMIHNTRTTDQAGRAVAVVGTALERQQPDALVLVGDRFETAAAALAATLQRVPIVHLHGGEETQGAFDDSLRHAITKLSHLHLVSHPDHASRVMAMGEAPDVVFVVGAPGLDNLHRGDLPGKGEIEEKLGIALAPPVVVVTVHPTTLALGRAIDGADASPYTATTSSDELTAVLCAMDRIPATYVVTLPNNDPGHERVREALSAAVNKDRRVAVEALGDRWYWGLLRVADAVLGNSSSALIEAPALGLPAVNVGDRQKGRLRGENVTDVPSDADAVVDALEVALKSETRARLMGMSSPFGDGLSAQRIVDVLAAWSPPRPPRKPPIVLPDIGR